MRTCGKRAKALFPDPEGMEATWECATSLHSGLAAADSGGQQSEHVAFWNPLCWCPVPIFIVHRLNIFIVSCTHNLSQENKSLRCSTDTLIICLGLRPEHFFFASVFSSRKYSHYKEILQKKIFPRRYSLLKCFYRELTAELFLSDRKCAQRQYSYRKHS